MIVCALVMSYGQSDYRPWKWHNLQPSAIQILET